MVTEVPVGSSYKEERLKELGVATKEKTRVSGRLGQGLLVVDTLPTNEEMEEGLVYAVRKP